MRATPIALLHCFLLENYHDRSFICRKHSAEQDGMAESVGKKPGADLSRIKEFAAHPGLTPTQMKSVRSGTGLSPLREETLKAFDDPQGFPGKKPKPRQDDKPRRDGERREKTEPNALWDFLKSPLGAGLSITAVLALVAAVALGRREGNYRQSVRGAVDRTTPGPIQVELRKVYDAIGTFTLSDFRAFDRVLTNLQRQVQVTASTENGGIVTQEMWARAIVDTLATPPTDEREARILADLQTRIVPATVQNIQQQLNEGQQRQRQLLEQMARNFIEKVEAVAELEAIAATVDRNPTTMDERSAAEVRAGTIAEKIWEAVLDGRIAPTVLDASMRDMLQNRTDMTSRQEEARAFIEAGWRMGPELLFVPEENLEAARKHLERFPTGATEYVIGDTNANYEATLHNLEQARLVRVEADGRIIWIGGETKLVFIGDTIADRNQGGLQTWKLIDSLEAQGARIDKFHGNHETQGMFYRIFEDQLRADTFSEDREGLKRVDYKAGSSDVFSDWDEVMKNQESFDAFRRQLGSFKLIDYNPANGRLYVHTDPVNGIFTFLDSRPEYQLPNGSVDIQRVNSTFQALAVKAADHMRDQTKPPLTPEEATLFMDFCESITHTNNRLRADGSNAVEPSLLRKLFPGTGEIVHGHSDNATDEGGENKEFIRNHPTDTSIRIVNTDTSFGKGGAFVNVGAEYGTPNIVGDFGEWDRLVGHEREALRVGHEAHEASEKMSRVSLETLTPEARLVLAYRELWNIPSEEGIKDKPAEVQLAAWRAGIRAVLLSTPTMMEDCDRSNPKEMIVIDDVLRDWKPVDETDQSTLERLKAVRAGWALPETNILDQTPVGPLDLPRKLALTPGSPIVLQPQPLIRALDAVVATPGEERQSAFVRLLTSPALEEYREELEMLAIGENEKDTERGKTARALLDQIRIRENIHAIALAGFINQTDPTTETVEFNRHVTELAQLRPERRARALRELTPERLDEVFRRTRGNLEMVTAINREIRIRDLVRIGTGTNTVQRTFLPENYTVEDMLAALDRCTTPESREQALAQWEKMQVFQDRAREARRLLPTVGRETLHEVPATVEAVRAEYRLLVEGKSTAQWTYFANEGVEVRGGVVEVPLKPANHQGVPFVGLRLANGMTVILPNPRLGFNQAMLMALFPDITQEQFSRSLADTVPTVAYPTTAPDGVVLAGRDLYDAATNQVRPYPVDATRIEGLTLATAVQPVEAATETPGARAWNRITQEWRGATLDLATPQEIRNHIVTVFEQAGTPSQTAELTEDTARERSHRILENAINSWIESRLANNGRLEAIMDDLASFHTDLRKKVDGTNAELAEAVETALETVQDARTLFDALHEGRENGNLQRANERTRALVSRMLLREFAHVGAEERDVESKGNPKDRTRSDAIRKMIYKVDNAPFEPMLPQPFKPENFEQLTRHFAGMVEGHLQTAEGSLARHFTNALARSGAAIEGANFQWNNAALNRAASWALETVMADHLDRQGAHLGDSQQLIDALRAFNVLPAETLDAMQVAHQRLDQLSRRLLRAVQGQPEGVNAAVTQAMAQFETFPADREITTRALRRLTQVTAGLVQENAKNALATLVPNENPGTAPLRPLTPEAAANRQAMMEKLNASRLTALRQARIASEIMANPDAREAWLNELRAIGEGKEPSADAATQDAARKIVNLVGQRLVANHNETVMKDGGDTPQRQAAMRKSIKQGSLRSGVVKQPGAQRIKVVEAPGTERKPTSAANERRIFDSTTDTLHRRATNKEVSPAERAKQQIEENKARERLKERTSRRP